MAGFGNLTLTDKGREALLKALDGDLLKFSKIAMGSGTNSSGYKSRTDLFNKRATADVTRGTVNVENGTYTVEAYFTNEDITEGFVWTEIGLYFEDENGNDVLYAAANAGEESDYIPATTDSRYAKFLRVTTAIGYASNVTITNGGTLLYTDAVTFAEHVSGVAHHHSHSFVTHDGTGKKYRIGLDAKGEYIQLYNEDGTNAKMYVGNKDELDTHVEDQSNPHNVTKAQLGLDEVENKSSQAIRDEITKSDISNALGYTPSREVTVDKNLSETSLNPVSNQAVTLELEGKAMVNHASLYTNYGVSTDSRYGHAKASSTIPKAGGVAAVGSETSAFARGDHVHPIQESDVGITTSGTGAIYTASVGNITELTSGVSFVMVPHVESTSKVPSLNVNGLGNKTLRRRLSGSTSATVAADTEKWLAKGKPVRVTYDGTYWIVESDKPDVNDLYGTLPIEKGGTGASGPTSARANLGVAPAEESEEYPGCYKRTGPTGFLEWINPPMDSNTSYNTTERRDNKSVTVCCFDFYKNNIDVGGGFGWNFESIKSFRVYGVEGLVIYNDGSNEMHNISNALKLTLKSSGMGVDIANVSGKKIIGGYLNLKATYDFDFS